MIGSALDDVASLVAIALGTIIIGLVVWKYFRSDPSQIDPWHNAIVGVMGIVLVALVIFPNIKMSVSPEGGFITELERQVAEIQTTAEEAKTESLLARSTAETVEAQVGALSEEVVEAQQTVARAVEIPQRYESVEAGLGAVEAQIASLTARNEALAERVATLEAGLDPAKPSETLLTSVFFDTNRSDLSQDARQELDGVYRRLRDQPYHRIRVVGHADSLGDDDANLRLSLQRIRSVAKYLIGKGIPPIKVATVAYGESDLPVTTPSATDEPLNRRVDIFAVDRP